MDQQEPPNKHSQPVYQLVPADQFGSQNDEIDLGALFYKLVQQWKLLSAIFVIGTVLSFVIALILPTSYVLETQIARPLVSDLLPLKTKGGIEISSQETFQRVVDRVKSRQHFNNFVSDSGWISRLSNEEELESKEAFVSKLWGKLVVKRIEEGTKDPRPLRRVAVSISGGNEAELAEFINRYVNVTNDVLLSELSKDQAKVVKLNLEDLENKIANLRKNEKQQRLLEIERILEENSTKIKTHEQEIAALLGKAIKDRESRIAQLKEALAIAKSMNIVKPTTMDAFTQTPVEPNNTEASLNASISVNANAATPVFLMGSEYLNNEVQQLQARKSDEMFIGEISELKRQISLLRNDERLAALRDRKSDDPFIELLPELLAEKYHLESLSMTFSEVTLFKVEALAEADGISEKPNKKLIAVLGSLFALFIALATGIVLVTFGSKIDHV